MDCTYRKALIRLVQKIGMCVIYNPPLYCKNSGTDWRHGVDIRLYLALRIQQGETDAKQQSTIIGQRLEVAVLAVWAL